MNPLFSIRCLDTSPRASSAWSPLCLRSGVRVEQRVAKPEEDHLLGGATQGSYGQTNPEVPT